VVLVVDDFPDGRELAVDILSVAGMHAVEAADGLSALERAFELIPDAIVMDLALPGLNGWDVVRRLKEDPRTCHIPVVALTAHALQAYRDRALEAGCDAFLAKPCAPRALVAEVRRILAAVRK
jgi:CheY-like chemotaxis protein